MGRTQLLAGLLLLLLALCSTWPSVNCLSAEEESFDEEPLSSSMSSSMRVFELESELADSLAAIEVDFDLAAETEMEEQVEKPAAKSSAKTTSSKSSAATTGSAKKGSTATSSSTANSGSSTRASRLTPEVQQAKYKRFTSRHSKRVNKKDPKGDFAQFSANRVKIVDLNDRYRQKNQPLPFASTGPFANLSPAEFKRRYRNTKHHSKTKSKPSKTSSSSKATSVSLPRTATSSKKKRSFLEVKLKQTPLTGSGKRVGGAGGAALKSGKTGGTSGQDATKSGKTGGAGGQDAGKSGKTGGTGNTYVSPVYNPSSGAFRPLTAMDVKNSLLGAGVSQSAYSAAMSSKSSPNIDWGDLVEQGTCGSCWAQVAANSLWRQYFYENRGNNPNLGMPRPSVQQILDCVKTDLSNGCSGGTPMDAMAWYQSNNFSPCTAYPMRPDGGVGTCKPSTAPSPFKSAGWKNSIPECTENTCKNQQAKEIDLLKLVSAGVKPIAYVDASNWQMYNDGIFPIDQCSSSLDAGDHVVEIVGWALNSVTMFPYWVVRNTWGVNWGHKGHIFLPFGVNACGVANFVIQATTQ